MPASESLKILFFMRNFSGYFRVFEPVFRVLLERGHRIHLAIDSVDRLGGLAWGEAMAEEFPGFTFSPVPTRKRWPWYKFAQEVRIASDYLPYLRPEFGKYPYLRERAAKRTHPLMLNLTRNPILRNPVGLKLLACAVGAVENGIPRDERMQEYIASHEPDVVLLTPHLMPGSLQPDYLLSAHALGLKTAVCVASWDNLSSKGRIRVWPDIVTVWNGIQRDEAIKIHGIPGERVVVTGAQCYDQWFDWKPRPREELCRRSGMDVNAPYLFYAAGSLFPSDLTEPEFVTQWLRAMRASDDPALRNIGVLIRPHPKRPEWRDVDLSEFGNVVVWPKAGAIPVESEARADYYDTIYHSEAVVGINTSAFIEAGIIGRQIYTVLLPEFWSSQEGTQHFHYLMTVEGGLLNCARSIQENLSQLSQHLAGHGPGEERTRRFIQAFVRPHGLDVPAAEVFADTVERLAISTVSQPKQATRSQAMLQPLNAALASSLKAAWESWSARTSKKASGPSELQAPASGGG